MLERVWIEENIGKHSLTNVHTNIFLGQSLKKLIERERNLNQWHLSKLRSICTAKETSTKSKRQPTEWEKIVAKAATDKGFIYKINQQLTNSTAKQQATQMIKQEEDLHRHFSREDMWMGNGHRKNCSTSLLLEKGK